MIQRLLVRFRAAKPIIQALLLIALGLAGAACWGPVRSVYYDLVFLHEVRANNDQQRAINTAKEQLIKQLQAQQGGK